MNWSDANNYCQDNSMKLAAVSEIREMYSLARTMNFMETDTYWTAANYVEGEGQWTWSGYTSGDIQPADYDYEYVDESIEDSDEKKRESVKIKRKVKKANTRTGLRHTPVDSSLLCRAPSNLLNMAAFFGFNNRCLGAAPKTDERAFICYTP